MYITIITNASRTVRWWEENHACFDDAVLSYHAEFADIDHHIAVADLLFERGLKVTALSLMDAKNWDRCAAMVDAMLTSKHPWSIEPKPVLSADGHGTDVYTPEQMGYFKLKRIPSGDWLIKRFDELRTHESVVLFNDDSARAVRSWELITNDWNRFKGWTCNIAFEGLAITSAGDVVASCHLNIFNGAVLNIFSEEFNLDVTPQILICPLDLCACQPDGHVNKRLL